MTINQMTVNKMTYRWTQCVPLYRHKGRLIQVYDLPQAVNDPDAWLTNIGTETHLELNPRSLQLDPRNELLLSKLRCQLSDVGPAVLGFFLCWVDDGVLQDVPFLNGHVAPVSCDDVVDLIELEQLSEHLEVGIGSKHGWKWNCLLWNLSSPIVLGSLQLNNNEAHKITFKIPMLKSWKMRLQ